MASKGVLHFGSDSNSGSFFPKPFSDLHLPVTVISTLTCNTGHQHESCPPSRQNGTEKHTWRFAGAPHVRTQARRAGALQRRASRAGRFARAPPPFPLPLFHAGVLEFGVATVTPLRRGAGLAPLPCREKGAARAPAARLLPPVALRLANDYSVGLPPRRLGGSGVTFCGKICFVVENFH